MKIRKNKSKEKETGSDVPSKFFNISFYINLTLSFCTLQLPFLFFFSYLVFLFCFPIEVKRKCVCVGGNEKVKGSVENIFFFVFNHFSYDRLCIYIHTLQYHCNSSLNCNEQYKE